MPVNFFSRRWGLGLSLSLVTVGSLAMDWRLVRRASTYPERPIMAVEWYTPQVSVPGMPGPPLARATTPPVPAVTEALQDLSAYAEARNSTGLIVLHRGQILWEEYWQGYDEMARFNAMSMSKTLVGLTLGAAIAAGDVPSLNIPAARYLPEWAQDERRAITLADLLYMQSGLRNDRRTDSLFSDLVQLYLGSDVVDIALNIPTVEPPGQRFDYNNVNTQLLTLVLERATGQPYAAIVSEYLWQPLAARDASIWLDRPQGSAKTFCCFFATARDWARVGQLILDQGRVGAEQVIPADWIQHMGTPSPGHATFGAHLWIRARTAAYSEVDQSASEPFLAPDTVYLDGRGVQRVFVIPSQDLVIVRMGEQPDSWDDAVLPNRLVAALSSPRSLGHAGPESHPPGP